MAGEIWAACSGPKQVALLAFEPWRVVEGQHVVATRALVDSLEEQALLEDLIDRAKPPPATPALAKLHDLLYTPFRYPPLRYGSRFGTRREPSLWYGSLEVRTALAEAAYYRLVFLEGTKAELEPRPVALTVFRAAVKAARGVDLTRAPFAAHEGRISSPVSYQHAQRLGADMRAAGVEAFLFVSARDCGRGKNAALFAPVFARKMPGASQTWSCLAAKQRVELSHDLPRERLAFPREDFLVGGKLPHPAV